MQLFALVAREDDQTDRGRKVVIQFLAQQLSKEQVDEYLKVYDTFYSEYHKEASEENEKKRKKISRSSVKILRICEAINAELAQKQKVIVVIRLLEFINLDGTIAGQELDFVSTVSAAFNLEDEEFLRSLQFVTAPASIHDTPHLLYITGDEAPVLRRSHHIRAEGMHGEVRILHIESVNLFILRYFGAETLFINGQPVRTQSVHVLTPGSSIRASGVSPVYYSDIVGKYLRDVSKDELVFKVDGIGYRFPSGKVGLHPIDLEERSGQMIGVMGASGAGKSTLLNILNGSIAPTDGSIRINGVDIHRQKKEVEGLIGHISQDDLLMEELTVFQNLYFNAKLCFRDKTEDDLKQMVMKTLQDLGLAEICDLKVGSPLNKKISGGQRKRLNIALELIREPAVLFVDEPTSGLSSRDSETTMDLLKELALKGKLVVVVIHQPSSDIYKMFDKLLVLDTGGFAVYYGNPVEAIGYFKSQINDVTSQEIECHNCGNVNPEQVFNIIESKVLDEYGQLTLKRRVSPAEWSQKYLEDKARNQRPVSTETKELDKLPTVSQVPSAWQQFKVFITRDVLSKVSDTQYMLINFLETPLLAVILAVLVRYYNNDQTGYIFRENDNLPAYIFMCVVVALFFGLTVSAEEIIKDRKILKREAFLNLSRPSYLMSKIAIMFAISAVQTASFVIIGNTLLGVQGMTLSYFLVLFSISCFANMLGLNISASFRNAVTIYILIPFLIIPQLLLSGVIVKFDKLNPSFSSDDNVPLAGEMMASKWAYEALAVHQYKANRYMAPIFKEERQMGEAAFRRDYWIPEMQKHLSEVTNALGKNRKDERYEYLLRLLNHEMTVQNSLLPEMTFNGQSAFENGDVSNSDLVAASAWLDQLKAHYNRKWNSANKEKEKYVGTQIAGGPEDDARYRQLLDDHSNESLTDLVCNANDLYRIIERDGRLIQRVNPIYQDPTSPVLRAHFLASRKLLGNMYIDTYWANVLVLWLMTLTLVITLYADALSRVLNFFEELMEKFTSKREG
jgi:ABC-type multidrug transport system ATPase subunit